MVEAQWIAIRVCQQGFAPQPWLIHRQLAEPHASINDLAITEGERKLHWPQGRRPDEHPGLSQLGL